MTSSKRTLEDLNFDNLVLRELPVESPPGENIPHPVKGAFFSRVAPTHIDNPRLVVASLPALSLLDIGPDQVNRPEFAEYFSGNKILPGSETYSHCYAGHQFGLFSGQLGDGAAIYLGEVLNSEGQRWEMQLKGAGLTPYSRQADGRKVLRSSLREFLASEAMHHLGIPTTRAGALFTSDTLVVRDPAYDGNPIQERASVVLRIAQTFLRFGSFEICLPTDATTGRAGPSPAEEFPNLIKTLLWQTIKTYFPEIWQSHGGDSIKESSPAAQQAMVVEWFREVLSTTARTVAAWQCVGFCHGVLNTDNMSILGMTIDYGPFGFLDRYDPEHVCNTSDDSGRYSYSAQPQICRWNCMKLAEALSGILPLGVAKEQFDAYDSAYNAAVLSTLRCKLGLTAVDRGAEDRALYDGLLRVMADTGADFSATFRRLALFPLPSQDGGSNAGPEQGSGLAFADGGFLSWVLGSLPGVKELLQGVGSRIPAENLRMLTMVAARDPRMLAQIGMTTQMLAVELGKERKKAELQKLTPASKRESDRASWAAWLNWYGSRLQLEAGAGANPEARIALMNRTNPRFVLRNWVAEEAIRAAEAGDFSVAQKVLGVLQDPFSTEGEQVQTPPGGYDGPVPPWAACISVSCSS